MIVEIENSNVLQALKEGGNLDRNRIDPQKPETMDEVLGVHGLYSVISETLNKAKWRLVTIENQLGFDFEAGPNEYGVRMRYLSKVKNNKRLFLPDEFNKLFLNNGDGKEVFYNSRLNIIRCEVNQEWVVFGFKKEYSGQPKSVSISLKTGECKLNYPGTKLNKKSKSLQPSLW